MKKLWPFGILCFFISMTLSASANAACSAYQGKVVFNEVFDPASGESHLEVKALDPGVVGATSNFSGWKVDLYKNNVSTKTSVDLSSIFTNVSNNNCGQQSAWIRIPDSALGNAIDGSNGSSNLNFVMYETSGNKIVDILRLGAASSFYGAGSNYASCPAIESVLPSAMFDAAWGVNGNKEWYRNPDGSGAWGGQESGNPTGTICGDNVSGGTFSLSKVPTLPTASTNTNFSFTLYAQNGATGSVLSNVQITDNLNTPGLTFVSCTTASGTCTESGGVVTWNIGAFAVGVTKTAVLTVRAATAGLKTNTIVANVTPAASASGSVQVNAPLADWRMDETGWNGTAGEVKDSSGNGYHGRARIAAGATSVATTASGTPAYTSGSENTCAYGEFDRTTAPVRTYSYVELSGFPALPTSFTFSAWIRSTNASAQHQRILVRDDVDPGWGLSLADGTGQPKLRFFNRNITNSGAVTGSGSNPGCGVFCLDTNAVLTSNAWHYIAATIDTVGKIITLYVYDASGTLLATTSSAFAGTWADGTGTASIGGESSASAEGRQASWHFLGNIDELQIFSGVLSQANIENLLTRTRACSGTPPPVPANFNCVESGADASTGHLYTKLAGTAFSFDVVALKTNGSVETTYASAANKNVTVELVDGSGATACASRTAISPAVSQTLAFTTLNQPTEQGRKAAASMTVSKAYPELRCRVTDANQSPSIVGCSTDSFSVRPLSFDSVTSSANGDNAGLSASAATVVKAGADFSLTAGTGTVGYAGLPKVDAAKIEWPNVPAGGRAAPGVGGLGGVFSTAANSTTGNGATGAAFTYSDVGYFRFQAQGVYDDTFTVQSADTTNSDCTDDFSNVLVSGKYGCKFGNTAVTNHFGRFIPDHFRVLSPPVFAPGCTAGGFSYMDQPFALSASIEAQNLADARTQNYTGSFANGAVTVQMENANSGVPLANTRLGGLGAPAWAAGSYPFTATQFLKLGTGPDGPYDTFDLGLSVADEGALSAASRPYLMVRDMDASTTTCTTDSTGISTAAGVCTATKLVNGSKIRYGRVRLQNANGSELLNLPLPVHLQYWAGTASGWQTNALDSCTAIQASDFAFSYPLAAANNLVPCETAITIGGAAPNYTATLTAPGAGNNGWTDITLNLGAAAAGNRCTVVGAAGAASTTANAPWMQFNWTGAVGNPSARATFGVYRSGPIIHRREMY